MVYGFCYYCCFGLMGLVVFNCVFKNKCFVGCMGGNCVII